MQDFISRSIENRKLSLNLLQLRIIDPSQQLQRNAQKLDEYEIRLFREINTLIDLNQTKLQQLNVRVHNNSENFIKEQARQLSNKVDLLNLLSPLNTLSRGYSITHNEQGKVLVSFEKINPGDLIVSKFHDGKVTSKVTKKEDN